ncbi:hypothetical protein [Nocardia nova]|uniref:hypothetical protein n=1 Tax=Nocardia nova TaxID=37330 RepID=UPI0018943137|nr:hypothetical protein [Nocardia nova]MBF6277025.1 hypothetical protein [Nocardia nova]
MISAILYAVLGATIVIVSSLVVAVRLALVVRPYQLRSSIAEAQPRIRHIIEHVADPDLCEVSLHRLTTLNLIGMDESAVAIHMAAVLLEVGRRAGMDTDEVLDMFGPGLPESIEDEL